jgi:hypothetical protein
MNSINKSGSVIALATNIPNKYCAEAMQVAIPMAANQAFSRAIVVHERLLLNTDSVEVNLDNLDFIFI